MKANSAADLLHHQRQDLDRRLGTTLHEWVDANAPAVFPHAAVIALLGRATTMAQSGSEGYRRAAGDCFKAALVGDDVGFQRASRAMHKAMVDAGMHHKGSGYTGPLRGPAGPE